MIGTLPTSLDIGGKAYKIRSDFRVILYLFTEVFENEELNNAEKAVVCLMCLYPDYREIPKEHLEEAIEKAFWFCDGGDIPKSKDSGAPILHWEHDEKMLFPAINKIAGFEVRNCEYMHWWTFLGYFGEIEEGLFSSVLHIRSKKARGKKLDKSEREYYISHKELIDIPKHSKRVQAEIDAEKAALEKILSEKHDDKV